MGVGVEVVFLEILQGGKNATIKGGTPQSASPPHTHFL
jgi:hypothetical protein